MAESGAKRLKGATRKLVTVVAVAMSLYHIMYVSHLFERFGLYILSPSHRAATVAFLTILGLLILPAGKGTRRDKVPWYDILIMILGLAGPVYLTFFWNANMVRYPREIFYPYEYAMGFLTLAVVLEITRRAVGFIMPLFALVFIAYMFTANYFPGFLYAQAASPERAAALLVYSYEGLYGMIMGVASTVIIMFTIFGAFLFMTPAGDFFLNLALSLFGHVRGGPAKAAVVGSGLFGTMSGSVPANIVTVGAFTIPMMKSVGYKPEVAAAVEAAASTGGQIMPPVMGASAFVMAEWLGIPYWGVVVAAFVPATLYYYCLFLSVDAEAQKAGLLGLPRAQCPSFRQTAKAGWAALIPLAALVGFMGIGQYSAELSILYALGVLIVLIMLQKKWRLSLAKWISALENGATGFIVAGICCATAGIIIGALNVTQLGIKLSDAIVALSGGNMFFLLLLAAMLCYILGMGLPTVSAYVMVAIFVAPALAKFDVPLVAAHLFVFYWAITAFITPPVAVGAFVASGIAGSNPMRTGFNAMKIAVVAYAVSFVFVYNPALVLQGAPLQIALAVVSAAIWVPLLAWGVEGYGVGELNPAQRVLLIAGALALMVPGWIGPLVGVGLGGLALAWQLRKPAVAKKLA